MSKQKLIFALTIPLILIAAIASARSKAKTRLLKIPRDTYIGIYRGIDLIDISRTTHNKNYMTAINNSFVVSIPLITHFKVNTGLTYSHINGTAHSNNIGKDKLPVNRPNQSIAVPVTIQYFMRPENCRLQPYFGLGAMFSPDKRNSQIQLNNDGYLVSPGTQYISIMFTQGVTYQVNTKIQLNESMHFLNVDGKNTVGMNFGIGFKLP